MCGLLHPTLGINDGVVEQTLLLRRFHNPWYTTWGGFKTEDCTRQAMEPLFKQYGVDLVYNGERCAFSLTCTQF